MTWWKRLSAALRSLNNNGSVTSPGTAVRPKSISTPSRRFALWLLLGTPWLVLYGPAFVTDQNFVFRDVAHYYYPLFHYVHARWRTDGEVPTWNPLDEAGRPLLGDPTACVLYPGQLLFFLPVSFATSFRLFLLGHHLLATGGAYWLARKFRNSRPAACLAAFSYGLSGHLLFQYSNPIFLIGGSWLPWAVGWLDQSLRRPTRRSVSGLSAALALTTLGGDPQTAYHILLMGVAYAVVIFLRAVPLDRAWRVPLAPRWRPDPHPAVASADAIGTFHHSCGRLLRQLLLLGMVAAAAGLLSAAQTWATWDWAVKSERALHDQPRTMYEALWDDRSPAAGAAPSPGSGLLPPEARSTRFLLGRPQPETHEDKIFDFSIGPWRWIELFWPNIGGRQFPVQRRWMAAIPAEGRVWTPSLYLGCIPVCWGLIRCRVRHRSARICWLSWVMIGSALATLGVYGAGWLGDEIRTALVGDHPPSTWNPAWGGLYWWMSLLLPFYVGFRYPAKLFGVTTLMISQLAAVHCSRWQRSPARSGEEVFAWLTAASLGGLAATYLLPLADWLRNSAADNLFGPLQANLAIADVRLGLCHTAVVGSLAWMIQHLAAHGADQSSSAGPKGSENKMGRFREFRAGQFRAAALVAITASELVVAHRWMLPTAPSRYWTQPSAMATAILSTSGESRPSARSASPVGADTRIYRAANSAFRHAEWLTTASFDRQDEVQQWDYNSLQPRYHLLHGIGELQVTVPFQSADMWAALRLARQAEADESRADESWPGTGEGRLNETIRLAKLLAASYLILPSLAAREIDDELLLIREGRPFDQVGGTTRANWLPASLYAFRGKPRSGSRRAYLLHDWQVWSELPPRARRTELLRRTEAILFAKESRPDFSKTAIIECDRPPGLLLRPASSLASEAARPSGQRAGGAPNAEVMPEQESCVILREAPQSVTLQACLWEPAVVVLADHYDEHWKCSVRKLSQAEVSATPEGPGVQPLAAGEWQTAPVFRVNRLLRGIALPRGKFVVQYRYSPPAARWGLPLMVASWLVLIGSFLWRPDYFSSSSATGFVSGAEKSFSKATISGGSL